MKRPEERIPHREQQVSRIDESRKTFVEPKLVRHEKKLPGITGSRFSSGMLFSF